MKTEYRFFCLVVCCLAIGNTAWAQPAIATQPQNQTVIVGTTAMFSVTATGTPPLFYQWRSYASAAAFTNILSATNDTLLLTNAQPTSQKFGVVVTNLGGGVTSALATLTVLLPPSITNQPASQSVSVGATVIFNVAAGGAVPFQYQWSWNGAALAGQTNRSLALTNVQTTNAGAYSVAVANAAGSVTSQVATLTVDTTFAKITTGSIVNDGGASRGIAWVDYDNDGQPDLFVANGNGQNNFLYHNNNNGTFTRITTGSIVADGGDSTGAAWADYDNDGHLDLFVSNNGGNFLYRNSGTGTFSRVLSGPVVTDSGNSRGGAWADFDHNGFVDLFVPRYQNNQGNALYRNNGNGTFTKIVSGPVATDHGECNFAAWGDYDDDGFVDLFVATDFQLKFLYQNNGDGTFAKIAADDSGLKDAGLAYSATWGDLDGDGDLDLFVTNWDLGKNYLHRNNGDGTFTKLTADPGVDYGGIDSGCSLGDYDNDGFVDLFLTTDYFSGPNALYHGNADGTFTKVQAGSLTSDVADSQGCGWADYDNDGHLDLFVANGGNGSGENNFLYRNAGNSNAWVKIKCVGTASNRLGIGAKIRLAAHINGIIHWQTRVITSGNGFGNGDLVAHFGLGDATNIDLIRVEWPSGIVEEWHDVTVRQTLVLTERPPGTLTLTAQPRSQGVAAGGRVKLVVKASGPPPLSFQWRSNGLAIAGATNRTLVFSNTQPAHAADYAVLVSAPGIAASILSDVATLTVTSPPPVQTHRFEEIQAGPSGTIRLSLAGAAPAMVRGYYDIYPLETSTTLSNWTSLIALVRTNNSPAPLTLIDAEGTNFAQRFFRTPTNHSVTPLPKPTGPFAVATLARSLGGKLVTFWYPTESKAGALPVRYVEDSFLTQRAAYRDYTDQVRSFRAFSISNVLMATNQSSYPVLIYSHSAGGHRRENIDKAEDLASHGYVVLATDHAESGSLSQRLATRAADARLLLDQLASLNSSDATFGGRLDLAKTGAFGWSLGGATAAELCRLDARCKAGVNLDGFFLNPALAQSGLTQPFMIINNSFVDFGSDFNDPNDDLRRVFKRLTQNAYRLKIAGTGHQNFGEPELVVTAAAYSRRAAEVTRAYLLAFFNKHLKGADNHLLDGASADFPEVSEFVRK